MLWQLAKLLRRVRQSWPLTRAAPSLRSVQSDYTPSGRKCMVYIMSNVN
jgi:hypothetical protein